MKIMKKIGLGASLAVVLFSVSTIKSEAYSVDFSNVYYHSSPYDFTPKAAKYTKSSYGINTTSLKTEGRIKMIPRANRVKTSGGYDKVQELGRQTLPNYAVEDNGPGVSTDIQFVLETMFWDGSRSTSSGSWQPDI
ncbi:hypothetical protein P4278_09015 [Bacillus thuringiensis]|uniref:hypothetical protein n=1 Tax=Bacillus TaxID=1386 RepID=UPI0009D87FEC|nr:MULTISPECIES: hypothetical protein [Bacillus]MED2749695.1 hypothetical protein [Bacillus thuringiensis]EKS7845607.1 hypothetical protein [Bacillus cereus]MEB2589485.1 hypothetical protein [Bacillus cereus]MEB2641496.1 hypothetical protein [Bacillus sp. DAG6]MED2754775.1 hypothetical protein [Bacillus thuringiensis]